MFGEKQMSTIKINQLNQNSSEFTSLNDRETAEVVGGYYYGGYSSYSNYYNYSSKFAKSKQANFNETNQVALGGGKHTSNGNSNSTSQGNSSFIDQSF